MNSLEFFILSFWFQQGNELSRGCRRGQDGRRAPRVQVAALLLAVIALAICVGGCHKAPPPRQFELKGKVVEVDRQLRRVTVAHDAIPGYMDAMTMPFLVKDDWVFGVARPGDNINATLKIDGKQSWLENAVITEEGGPEPAGAGSASPEGGPEPRAGDQIPDFSLTNQDSSRIHLSQYRDRGLVLTFIYSRCPLPDFCPLMSSNLAEVDKELQKDPGLYARTHLLSVTIDPDFDTSEVLQNYGKGYTEDTGRSGFDHWEFATGSKDEIKSIAEYFGLRYWNDGGQIIHSLRTAVVSPDGKLVKLYRGNDWKPADIVRDLQGLKLD